MDRHRPLGRPLRNTVALAALALGCGVWAGCGKAEEPAAPPAQVEAAKAYIGQTRKQTDLWLKSPTKEYDGYPATVPADVKQQHPNAKTLEYDQTAGTLFLSFAPRGADWVCVASEWQPKGK